MKRALLLALTLMICVVALSVRAQDSTITDDQVNAIAKKLYCPVCENITLDTCGTAACADWRYEIRLQLEAGRTEQQIVDDFVTRFGDRVVGTPQDALLRALSLVTPWVIIAGVLLILGRMVWMRGRPHSPAASDETAEPPVNTAQKYQDLIERDLEG